MPLLLPSPRVRGLHGGGGALLTAVTSCVSVTGQLNGRRQAAPRDGSKAHGRVGWLTGVVWGVSWWFLAVAGSWGSALGHESDPPWPFEQLRCNPHALKMATGRLTSSE